MANLMVVIDGVRWRRDEAEAKGLLKRTPEATTDSKAAPTPANKAAAVATKDAANAAGK